MKAQSEKGASGFGRIAEKFESKMAPALAGLSAASARSPCKAIWAVLTTTLVVAAHYKENRFLITDHF